MLHLVARSVGYRVLFRDWREARVLWDCVVASAPGLAAMVLMPNHLHVLHTVDVRRRLAAGLGGYVRWRHAQRGDSGRVFEPLPEPESLDDALKVRMAIRYVHLNPARAELMRDPLSWPFSTHRDACGLAEPPAIPRVRDVPGFHRHVTTDSYVSVEGTELPGVTLEVKDPRLVLHAVSALTRTCLADMPRRGRARTLYLRAALDLCPAAPRSFIGELVRVRRAAVVRAARANDPAVRLVARVVSDPRFPPLDERRLFWPSRRYRD